MVTRNPEPLLTTPTRSDFPSPSISPIATPLQDPPTVTETGSDKELVLIDPDDDRFRCIKTPLIPEASIISDLPSPSMSETENHSTLEPELKSTPVEKPTVDALPVKVGM
jgi:hypothetical protein